MSEDSRNPICGNCSDEMGPAADVLAEIREECRLFADIVRSSRACRETFSTAEGPNLERLVAEREEHLAKIEKATARLASLREKWSRDIASVPAVARKELDAELDKLGVALNDMLAAEEECAKLGLARREATVQRLRDMANFKKIDSVYKVKKADHSRFLDTNE